MRTKEEIINKINELNNYINKIEKEIEKTIVPMEQDMWKHRLWTLKEYINALEFVLNPESTLKCYWFCKLD